MPINVYVTDEGFQPPYIAIPAGRLVRLVLRNSGTTEHHYRVVGLVPLDPLWRSEAEDMSLEEGVTDEDTNPTITLLTCRSGPRRRPGLSPLGDEVHTYALRGSKDAMFFTATSTGTYSVQCPLHPEKVGQVTVF
jgi:plastocyanin